MAMLCFVAQHLRDVAICSTQTYGLYIVKIFNNYKPSITDVLKNRRRAKVNQPFFGIILAKLELLSRSPVIMFAAICHLLFTSCML